MKDVQKNDTMDFSYFYKIIRLFVYSKKFQIWSINDQLQENQFSVISKKWLDLLKEELNYEENKKALEEYMNVALAADGRGFSYQSLENNKIAEFLFLYFKSQDSFKVSKKRLEEINKEYQKCKKLKKPFNNKEIYTDFTILDQSLYNEITKDLESKEEADKSKISGLIGNHQLILYLSDAVQLIKIDDNNDFDYQFLITFPNFSEIKQNNGMINFFGQFLEKIDIHNLESQKIADNRGNQIAEAINIEGEKIKDKIDLYKSLIILNTKNNLIRRYSETYIKKSSNLNPIYKIGNNKEKDFKKDDTEDRVSPSKRGLVNQESNCYINSGLQCLASIPELKQFFLDELNRKKFEENIYYLSYAFSTVINGLYPEDNFVKTPFNPQEFMEAYGKINKHFVKGSAGDAKNFLVFTINKLHEELNNFGRDLNLKKSKSGIKTFNNFLESFQTYYNSIFSDNFYWINQTIITCTKCSEKNSDRKVLYQAFPYIIFDLDKIKWRLIAKEKEGEFPNIGLNDSKYFEKYEAIKKKYFSEENTKISLQDCFKNYSLIFQYKDKCQKCGQNTVFDLQNKIYFSPNIFIIILNRGSHNIYSVKLDFPETINLEEYILSPECCHKENDYELFAVINHKGLSGSQGHFFSFIKDQNEKQWYRFSDEIINPADKTDIMGEGIPYVLFYRAK